MICGFLFAGAAILGLPVQLTLPGLSAPTASPASSPALRQFLIHMFKLVQMEQQRSSELEKNNTKLKSTMTEMHAKHVSPLNLAAQNALLVSHVSGGTMRN